MSDLRTLSSGMSLLCYIYRLLRLPRLFFSNAAAPTDIYTLSLHDALPISTSSRRSRRGSVSATAATRYGASSAKSRSEEHTSELQSLRHLVCRLLLEKKKNK